MTDTKLDTARDIAQRNLGYCGRMISGSKTGYVQQHPNNTVVFNANLCTKSVGKFWYGDIDVTKDVGILRNIAAAIGEHVYILREMDGRFDNETNPKFDNACVVISPTEIFK